jgi:hypothetical protein
MDALTVETLADILQEPQVPLLRQVLRTLGQDRCAAILADTRTCEANGGMLTKDGTRRRTPGGVFFQLVRERATPQERRRLFPYPTPQRGQVVYLCAADKSPRLTCRLSQEQKGLDERALMASQRSSEPW